MEASISLCHFCEQHGPTIMMTTQKLATGRLEADLNNTTTSSNSTIQSGGSSDSSLVSKNIDSLQRSNTMKSDSSSPSDSSRPCSRSSSSRKRATPCESCRSLPPNANKTGFVTHDPKSSVSYVSSRHPANLVTRQLLKQACVSSLTGELCPQGEGPFMFGDEASGYVISYVFSLKDSHARGKKKTFSFVYVSSDRVFLIQSMPFIAGCMASIVKYLQRQADAVYTNETTCRLNACASIRAKMFNSVTPKHLRQQAELTDERSAPTSARPLARICSTPELYRYLHKSFTWVLKSARDRLRETVCYGRPLEDEVVLAEREESELLREREDLEPGRHDCRPDVDAPEFKSLRHLRATLQPPLFRAIMWHLLIGNQVIWRGRPCATVTSALRVMSQVLPRGCVKTRSCSTKFVNSYCANLLGLSGAVTVPEHVRSSQHYVLIDVVANRKRVTSFADLEFRMTSGCTIPEKLPTLLCRLDAALGSSCFSEEVLHDCLLYYKEEWINNAKVLYKFARIDNRNKQDAERLLYSVLGCACPSDVKLLKFWMTGLSQKFKLNLRQSVKRDNKKS